MLELAFDTRRMELVQRWWNGRFGRLARRDIWLEREVIWHVRARNGDGDSKIKAWTYTDRNQAEAMVDRLRSTGGDGWKNLTPANPPGHEQGTRPAQPHASSSESHYPRTPQAAAPKRP